jgi:hypothetical protein
MPYRKRYQRGDPDDRPGIDLTDRDAELLRIAYDYEPATTEIINALAPRHTLAPGLQAYHERTRPAVATSTATSRTRREVYRRLGKLFDHAYLDRRKLRSANDPTVHLIDNLGMDELAARFHYARKRIDWQARNREIGVSHLWHSLMISNFHCALTVATRAIFDTSIAVWYPDGSVHERVAFTEMDGRGTYTVELPVTPDATFALVSAGKRSHFFLEADRTTTDHGRFLEKLTAYVHFGRQGLHRERLKIPGFHLLIITKSVERRDNLCALAREAFGRKDSKRFWFATEKNTWRDALGKICAEALLQPIWYVPGENEPRALLTR